MVDETYEDAIRDRMVIRLDTLIRLRWYAIIGQAGAIIFVAFVLGYETQWALCLLLIAVSAVLNVVLTQQYKANHRLPSEGAFGLLAFDIIQLGVLLFLTGGLQNPFCILVIAPVVVSSTSLRTMHTIMLGALAIFMVTLLASFHLPLPWAAGNEIEMPQIYIVGVWVALVCTMAFTTIYAFRVAEETRRLADALAATELILQREQHLSVLDGLAAAAAHELGTPLATIALVSKEMAHAFPADSDFHEDAKLLRSQAQRCRDILQKLTSLSSDGESIVEYHPLTAMIEEEVAPLRDFGIDIEVRALGEASNEPRLKRSPGVHYGLGNLVDNAVDFAKSKVILVVNWDDDFARIEMSDDGPGFPSAILDKIGEPFVTSRKVRKGAKQRGMGLGLFISKTLLERSGAEITFSNKTKTPGHLSGAFVSLSWRRDSLESIPPLNKPITEH